jgi:hypothetical protein
MRQYLKALIVVAFAAVIASAAHAQQTNYLGTVFIADPTTLTHQLKVNSDGSINVDGTFSSTLGGFTPGARGTPLTVTTSDSSGTLPVGAVVVVSNVGTNPMYCNVLDVAATTADQPVTSGGGWFAFTIPSGSTALHCIATGGSTTANMLGGTGLPTGTGGGSGSGSGGNVNLTQILSAAPSATNPLWVSPATGATFPVSGTFWQATQPVSGTFWQTTQPVSLTSTTITGTVAATESGVWTVQPGNTANTVAWLVTGTGGTFPVTGTFWQATQPVSNAGTFAVQAAESGTWTVGLSAGAATIGAVTQASGPWTINLTQVDGTALGAPSNYGTSPGAVEVLGVNAYVTNIPAVTQSGTWTNTVTQATPANLNATVVGTGTFAVQATLQASSATAIGTVNPTTIATWGLAASTQNVASPTNGILALGQFNTTPTTITTGNVSPFQLDNAGNLLVNVKVGGGAGGTSSSFSATFPATGTAAGAEYLSSAPSLTTGQMVALQVTSAGSLHTTVDNTNNNVTDATSGIATSTTFGSPVVNHNYFYNGTTWDQAQDDASKNLKVGVYTVPSGAVASGAFASGSLAAGSMVDLLTMRGAVGAGTAPADALIGGAVYNSTPLTVGNTQSAALQSDPNGFLKVNVAAGTAAVNQTQVNGSTYSVTNPGFTEITDGTNGAAAVKPASTPSPATDKSLSVTINAGSNGIVALGQATKANSVPVTFASDQDPCSYAQKSSAPITITTATTTQLVAVSGSTSIYVCGFSFSASNVVTTANTLYFEYGTSTNCTGTTALTGTYGTGSVVAAAPSFYSMGNGLGTVFKTTASQGLCAVTTIGATAAFEGVLTYVQQ